MSSHDSSQVVMISSYDNSLSMKSEQSAVSTPLISFSGVVEFDDFFDDDAVDSCLNDGSIAPSAFQHEESTGPPSSTTDVLFDSKSVISCSTPFVPSARQSISGDGHRSVSSTDDSKNIDNNALPPLPSIDHLRADSLVMDPPTLSETIPLQSPSSLGKVVTKPPLPKGQQSFLHLSSDRLRTPNGMGSKSSYNLSSVSAKKRVKLPSNSNITVGSKQSLFLAMLHDIRSRSDCINQLRKALLSERNRSNVLAKRIAAQASVSNGRSMEKNKMLTDPTFVKSVPDLPTPRVSHQCVADFEVNFPEGPLGLKFSSNELYHRVENRAISAIRHDSASDSNYFDTTSSIPAVPSIQPEGPDGWHWLKAWGVSVNEWDDSRLVTESKSILTSRVPTKLLTSLTIEAHNVASPLYNPLHPPPSTLIASSYPIAVCRISPSSVKEFPFSLAEVHNQEAISCGRHCCMLLRPGLLLTHVNGLHLLGLSVETAFEILKSSTSSSVRPLKLRFVDSTLERQAQAAQRARSHADMLLQHNELLRQALRRMSVRLRASAGAVTAETLRARTFEERYEGAKRELGTVRERLAAAQERAERMTNLVQRSVISRMKSAVDKSKARKDSLSNSNVKFVNLKHKTEESPSTLHLEDFSLTEKDIQVLERSFSELPENSTPEMEKNLSVQNDASLSTEFLFPRHRASLRVSSVGRLSNMQQATHIRQLVSHSEKRLSGLLEAASEDSKGNTSGEQLKTPLEEALLAALDSGQLVGWASEQAYVQSLYAESTIAESVCLSLKEDPELAKLLPNLSKSNTDLQAVFAEVQRRQVRKRREIHIQNRLKKSAPKLDSSTLDPLYPQTSDKLSQSLHPSVLSVLTDASIVSASEKAPVLSSYSVSVLNTSDGNAQSTLSDSDDSVDSLPDIRGFSTGTDLEEARRASMAFEFSLECREAAFFSLLQKLRLMSDQISRSIEPLLPPSLRNLPSLPESETNSTNGVYTSPSAPLNPYMMSSHRGANKWAPRPFSRSSFSQNGPSSYFPASASRPSISGYLDNGYGSGKDKSAIPLKTASSRRTMHRSLERQHSLLHSYRYMAALMRLRASLRVSDSLRTGLEKVSTELRQSQEARTRTEAALAVSLAQLQHLEGFIASKGFQLESNQLDGKIKADGDEVIVSLNDSVGEILREGDSISELWSQLKSAQAELVMQKEILKGVEKKYTELQANFRFVSAERDSLFVKSSTCSKCLGDRIGEEKRNVNNKFMDTPPLMAESHGNIRLDRPPLAPTTTASSIPANPPLPSRTAAARSPLFSVLPQTNALNAFSQVISRKNRVDNVPNPSTGQVSDDFIAPNEAPLSGPSSAHNRTPITPMLKGVLSGFSKVSSRNLFQKDKSARSLAMEAKSSSNLGLVTELIAPESSLSCDLSVRNLGSPSVTSAPQWNPARGSVSSTGSAAELVLPPSVSVPGATLAFSMESSSGTNSAMSVFSTQPSYSAESKDSAELLGAASADHQFNAALAMSAEKSPHLLLRGAPYHLLLKSQWAMKAIDGGLPIVLAGLVHKCSLEYGGGRRFSNWENRFVVVGGQVCQYFKPSKTDEKGLQKPKGQFLLRTVKDCRVITDEDSFEGPKRREHIFEVSLNIGKVYMFAFDSVDIRDLWAAFFGAVALSNNISRSMRF